MSNRHVRKLLGDTVLPPPDDSEDEVISEKRSYGFQYAGLEVESGSAPERSQESSEEKSEIIVSKKKNKKKKKKKKQSAHRDRATPCGSKDEDPEGEVERLVREVNAVLGTPEPAPPPVAESPPATPSLMDVQLKMLNYNYEVKKVFGPEALGEKESKRRNRTADLMRILKKPVLVPVSGYMETFGRNGLSMSLHRKEGSLLYFTIDHDPEYQRVHRDYRRAFAGGQESDVDQFVSPIMQNHVEIMLEYADRWFTYEQHQLGRETLEHAIAFYQFIAHPQFKLNDRNVRLDYKVMENRAFFVSVLKYIYLLSNKACHRTALELAKMLLNLDPSDPLAVIIVIDVIALRAREHRWLVDAIRLWKQTRQAGLLYNMQYSEALAHYHVAVKDASEEGKEHASHLLEQAIINFPLIANKILQHSNVTHRSVLDHKLFKSYGVDSAMSGSLPVLTSIYAELTWPRWIEPDVLVWLVATVRRVTARFDEDLTCEARAGSAWLAARGVYRSYAADVHRHLCVIRPLSELCVGGKVPRLSARWSCDPAPAPAGVDRYGYDRHPPRATPANVLFQFLDSLLPHYRPADAHANGQ